MRLAELRRAQDTITQQVLAAAVAVLRTLAGRPLPPEVWRLLVDALFPTVVQGRQASHELAVRFYRAQRADYSDQPVPTLNVPAYGPDALEHTLRRTVFPRLSQADTARAAISDAAGALARHVEQAGRDTITTAARLDRVALGWARVPTGRETCAFCWMLASRGPVYRTAASAGEMTAWHDRCDCHVTPVFDRDTWDGRDTFRAAQQLWRDATRGHSGRDALNAFRRSLAGTTPNSLPGALQTAA
ncbi:hypothetical protein [Actinophytocola sp.]|uniref:VG15 protein n=1 Tax=Actinophytocola sp. TaxID=1872138 RepID=UPI003D6BFB98